MLNLKKTIILYLVSVLAITGCKEDMPQVLTKSDSPPGPVSNVRVENLPGSAKLKYSIPGDENLLYIKAVYEFPKGVTKEVKASMYSDSLVIDGIGSTDDLEVKLYAVSRAEISSDPVSVKISPLTPPVHLVGATLQLREDFGGVTSEFENPTEANLVITILIKDGNEWIPIETLYTNRRAGFFTARGQKAEPREFGVFVKDRWNNKSDTLTMVLSPLFEMRIPAPVPVTTLANDYNQHFSVFKYTYLFDGIVSMDNYAGTLLNSPSSRLPQSFTLDFKKPTNFSRLKYWMRMNGSGSSNGYDYNHGAPEIFEIWASNVLDADWSKWTKLMDCQVFKPSKLPPGQLTQEDRDYALAGFDFNFPTGIPAYRYIRWKTTKNFGTVDYVQFSELAFWGSQL